MAAINALLKSINKNRGRSNRWTVVDTSMESIVNGLAVLSSRTSNQWKMHFNAKILNEIQN